MSSNHAPQPHIADELNDVLASLCADPTNVELMAIPGRVLAGLLRPRKGVKEQLESCTQVLRRHESQCDTTKESQPARWGMRGVIVALEAACTLLEARNTERGLTKRAENLNRREVQVLDMLAYDDQPRNVTEIAARLDVNLSVVSKAVSTLSMLSLIERADLGELTDGRYHFFRTTELGRKYLRAHKPPSEHHSRPRSTDSRGMTRAQRPEEMPASRPIWSSRSNPARKGFNTNGEQCTEIEEHLAAACACP